MHLKISIMAPTTGYVNELFLVKAEKRKKVNAPDTITPCIVPNNY